MHEKVFQLVQKQFEAVLMELPIAHTGVWENDVFTMYVKENT